MSDVFALERDTAALEADRLGDHPHPREVLWYGGESAAERTLLDAFRSGRLHHAWLITGPEGVGKATLAYRFARFLLAHPDPGSAAVAGAQDLAVAPDHPVVGQVARLSHPDLAVIRRQPTKDGKSLKGDIAVEDVRDGLSIFRTTSGGGRLARRHHRRSGRSQPVQRQRASEDAGGAAPARDLPAGRASAGRAAADDPLALPGAQARPPR